jgi:outer membrane protein assembly factor BamB
MKLRPVLALLAAAALGASLAGCATVEKVNPFHKDSGNKVKASEGERIPLIAYNQTLEVSDALKGQEFFLPDPQAEESWPQAGGVPGQWNGNLAAAPDFKVAWKKGFGQASSRKAYVTAPPVAADGRIYVMDAEARVSAIDGSSGQTVWRTDLAKRSKRDHDAFGGGLAYADGRLYVTSGYRFVAALDAKTGKAIWTTQVDTPIHGAPTVMSGRVMAINVDDELETFNIETGAQDWTYQSLTEPARILAASSPTPAGDTVIAGFASGELAALGATNGNEEWTTTLSRTSRTNALSEIRDIAGRPVVYQGVVFAGSHSGVFTAVDIRSGAPRWTLPVTTITTPWPVGDVVFMVSQAGEVICASRETGQVYWITDLNKGLKKKARALWFGPILASGRLIVVSDKGKALALDPKKGTTMASLNLGSDTMIPPIAQGGSLYVVTNKAELVAIR